MSSVLVCCVAVGGTGTGAGARSVAEEAPRDGAALRLRQLKSVQDAGKTRYGTDGLAYGLGSHTAVSKGGTVYFNGRPVASPDPPGAVPQGTDTAAKGASTDWTPYGGPFTRDEAAHLLRRAVIGPRWEEIDDAVAAGLDAQVAELLLNRPPPAPPGLWATQPVPDVQGWSQEMIDSLLAVYYDRAYLLQLWWTEAMLHQETSLRETMTLFWHDHFATGISKVIFPQSIFVQNRLFRNLALQNFKVLAREAAYDPAMLLWLDGQYNYVNYINENFARELLELFTMGVDEYTQDDVVAAARAFTGYVTYDGVTSVFVPSLHDGGYKVFLGQGGNWDGDDIIDIIFEQDVTARFICTKLYKYFIDEYPDEALIEDLAQTMRDNDYEVLPVLEMMFKSEHFFDQEFRGSIIADGVDKIAGLMRSLYIDPDLTSADTPSATWVLFGMGVFDHVLFEPPNVAGWPGYRSWINSYTLLWRKTMDVGLVDGQVLGFNIQMQTDVMDLANRFTNPNDADALIDDLAFYLFGMPPTELVRQRMMDELLQGAQPWEWNMGYPEAESRLQGLVKLALRLPDQQVK
jgi:hypothetical protein